MADDRALAESFDRICSIGMFEHVRARNYAAYFEIADCSLKREGLLLLNRRRPAHRELRANKNREPCLMYKRILVPIDGSDTAALGLDEAIRLARHHGGTLRLTHVLNELIVADAPNVHLAPIVDSLFKGGRALLEEAAALVQRAGVEVQPVLLEAVSGQAGPAIVQQAKYWRADLIVMGTHGRHGVRRLVIGSDAEYVLRRTPVPVLLIRHYASASGGSKTAATTAS